MTKQTDKQADPARSILEAIAERSQRVIGFAGGIASLAGCLWIGQAWLAASAIADLLGGSADIARSAAMAAAFLAIGLIRHAGDAFAGRIAFTEALKAVATERAAIVRNESLSSPFFAGDRSSATVATLIGAKLDQFLPWMTRYNVASTKAKVVPLVILGATFVFSWAAGLILLVAGPLIPVFMALIGFAARDASEKHMAETGTLNAMLLEWLNAGSDIRLLDAREATVKRFDAAADSLRIRTMAVLKVAFLSSTVLELFSAIGIAMAAVFVGFSLLGTFHFGTYNHPMTAAEGIFILLLVPDYFQPLRELAAAWHDRAAALAVAGEIAELRSTEGGKIIGVGGKAEPLPGPATVSVTGLAFQTPASRRIRFPDFTAAPGEKLAITGGSGAGKSTLIALLTGMASPSAGRIEVAGVTLEDQTADGWRQRFAYVGQHPHMLNASLRANIGVSGDRILRGRLEDAVRTALADDVVAALPRGFDTRLGENGSGVSGGEARRLTIARAVYKGADVIFADEPTADLDRDTADRICEALIAAAAKGATLIVATHDPVLVAMMDREVQLEAAS